MPINKLMLVGTHVSREGKDAIAKLASIEGRSVSAIVKLSVQRYALDRATLCAENARSADGLADLMVRTIDDGAWEDMHNANPDQYPDSVEGWVGEIKLKKKSAEAARKEARRFMSISKTLDTSTST